MVFKDDKAIYLQIADYIKDNILAKKWRENDRMPSVRDMAVSIEVNPNTVIHSYNYMQEKGIIYNKRGVGYFVADGAVTRARLLEKETFFDEQLPQLFKNMLLLNLDIDEIARKFEEYKQDSSKGKQ